MQIHFCIFNNFVIPAKLIVCYLRYYSQYLLKTTFQFDVPQWAFLQVRCSLAASISNKILSVTRQHLFICILTPLCLKCSPSYYAYQAWVRLHSSIVTFLTHVENGLSAFGSREPRDARENWCLLKNWLEVYVTMINSCQIFDKYRLCIVVKQFPYFDFQKYFYSISTCAISLLCINGWHFIMSFWSL